MSKNVINKLEYLDYLIKRKATGNPKELAHKLNISERGVYNYIGLLKELGASIKFCRKRNSYHYTEEGQFYFKFLHSDSLSQ